MYDFVTLLYKTMLQQIMWNRQRCFFVCCNST